jgi:hypothetical protein
MAGRESGVRSQESGVRSQESGVRSQESGVRSQESRGVSVEVNSVLVWNKCKKAASFMRAREEEGVGHFLVLILYWYGTNAKKRAYRYDPSIENGRGREEEGRRKGVVVMDWR